MENPFNKDNLKKMAKGALLAGALVFAPNTESQAQNTKQEQTITQNTKWMQEAIKIANNDLKYIKNQKDAFEYSIKISKLLTSQIGMIAEESNKNKDYSLEEYQYLFKQAKKIKDIIATLDNTYDMNRVATLDNLMFILEKRSSYGGYNEYKRIKDFKN